ncbi:MAG: SGNH/GDSL hydrolase family protein [Planctomycetia bacterium]|nr:SGNH/GDSL hydrolase family protein [Planctomycetia bacterium]
MFSLRGFFVASRRLPVAAKITALLILATVLNIVAPLSTAVGNPLTQMFVFGDSLSDTGNVYAKATLNISDSTGVLYNGPANFPGPKPPALSGNGLVNNQINATYNYTKARFTDGTDTTPATAIIGVWEEQLAKRLNLALPEPSTGGGTNYAYGGAETKGGQTTIASTSGFITTTVTSSATVDNLGQQIANFSFDHFCGCAPRQTADPNAVYTIWAGGNDLINAGDAAVKAAKNGQAFDATTVTAAEATAVANVKAGINTLYDLGANNIVWPNLPPISLTPHVQAWLNNVTDAGIKANIQTVIDAEKMAAANFAEDEAFAIADLKTQDQGIKVAGVDVWSLFTKIAANPGDFGFTNTTSPAQGQNVNPDNYVFWDDIHPTTKADQMIAGAAYASTVAAGIPEPSTFMLLGIAAPIFILWRWRHGQRE